MTMDQQNYRIDHRGIPSVKGHPVSGQVSAGSRNLQGPYQAQKKPLSSVDRYDLGENEGSSQGPGAQVDPSGRAG